MDYCNGVRSFINYATFIPRNISEGGIRCSCKRCQNKKFLHPDVVTMHLLHKEFMEEYICWYAHGEPFVPHKTMVERMIGSISSANNVHGVETNNSNPYRTMVMDAMKMNQGHVNQYRIIDEEPNAYSARFFDFLKDIEKPLWDDYTNHSKLSVVALVFTIKLDFGLSEADCDRIVEWARSILLEGNRMKENFYVAKSMMKPLGLGY